MTALTDWLDAAKARTDAATDGLWEMDGDSVWTAGIPATSTAARQPSQRVAEIWTHDADAEFIAAARTDLPKALDALRAVLDVAAAEEQAEFGTGVRPALGTARLRTLIAAALGVTPDA